MSTGELIAWYLANGSSMEAIRAIFPEFFQEPVEPPALWGALDWLNQWHQLDSEIHEHAQAAQDHLYPHL